MEGGEGGAQTKQLEVCGLVKHAKIRRLYWIEFCFGVSWELGDVFEWLVAERGNTGHG